MAQQRNTNAVEVRLRCSICQDLLEDPVTIPCGHNYCMSCIKTLWDANDQENICSCPQCRKTFIPRPELVKNTMMADLVEDVKMTGLQADQCSAGDVACDFCTGRKMKAVKSCLVCLASYCEEHLQPHYRSTAFKRHKLMEASAKIQDSICSRHNELMKIFCRTDQRCICILCSVDEHRGHDTVSTATERSNKQKEVDEGRQKLQQRILQLEKDVEERQQEMEAINRSADKAVEDSVEIFVHVIDLTMKRSSEVKEKIRSQQQSEVSQVKELQEKLEQQIKDLKRKDAELEELSRTVDHTQFLQSFSSESQPAESTDSPRPHIHRLLNFEDVLAAVSATRDKIEDILTEKKLSEPTTRAEFLQYSRQITLDPNTVNKHLVLSDGNSKITFSDKSMAYPQHPDRFSVVPQVLSKDGLSGRCYWEVEMSRYVGVAVAYKTIRRSGGLNAYAFGCNEKSWLLNCGSSFTFRHANQQTPVCGPRSSRVGVFLDHSAGVLSFYSVSDSMALLHRVHTSFTEPLHTGLRLVGSIGDTAELCKLH